MRIDPLGFVEPPRDLLGRILVVGRGVDRGR
ncbi:hypothetical protein QFZ76_001584 [Streptomyces sp. V4I2]|nr:hypothetical protein [Streptomyces sp. V4I2]